MTEERKDERRARATRQNIINRVCRIRCENLSDDTRDRPYSIERVMAASRVKIRFLRALRTEDSVKVMLVPKTHATRHAGELAYTHDDARFPAVCLTSSLGIVRCDRNLLLNARQTRRIKFN